ncbi:hypothetical protein Tcan_08514 [Toxocara canis]|uniref:Uncharacterized protein n=1 Tax=Toxocara canis TaxID=6265 RepID=A0A0B2VIY4_TOXCA|nr:hypothetical protein Tcan_08514 [Toxocara canis]
MFRSTSTNGEEALSHTSVRFRVYKRRQTGSSQFLGETLLVNSLIDARGGILTHHTLAFHHSIDSNPLVRQPSTAKFPLFPSMSNGKSDGEGSRPLTIIRT